MLDSFAYVRSPCVVVLSLPLELGVNKRQAVAFFVNADYYMFTRGNFTGASLEVFGEMYEGKRRGVGENVLFLVSLFLLYVISVPKVILSLNKVFVIYPHIYVGTIKKYRITTFNFGGVRHFPNINILYDSGSQIEQYPNG